MSHYVEKLFLKLALQREPHGENSSYDSSQTARVHLKMGTKLFLVFMQEFFGQMTDVVWASSQSILMYFIAAQVVGEGEHLKHDHCRIETLRDPVGCLHEMIGVQTVDPSSVFLADIIALSIQAIGINDFKKVSHQFLDCDLLGIKNCFHTFGIAVIVSLSVRLRAVSSTRLSLVNTR